jgi:hypothetical protein
VQANLDLPPPAPPENYRRAVRRQFVLRQVEGFSDRFKPDFGEWLFANMHVWEAFEREAERVWATGRRHYSSRTLWEVMRHETTLRERDGEFKLNNDRAPDIARLYLLMYPDRDGFFETRGRPA